jgi:hypothetical protein
MILEVKETKQMRGRFILEIINNDTGEKSYQAYNNILTDVNREYRQDMLTGNTGGLTIDDLEIKYFGLGDTTGVVDESDIQLVNEIIRKQVTGQSVSGDTVTTTVQFLGIEANFRIRQIGVFCGSGATAALDSGLMISIVNVDFTKNSNITLNVIRKDITTI